MTESLPPTGPQPTPSGSPLRLMGGLTILLALGNLVWFLGSLSSYLHWPTQGWVGAALPILLLWGLLGLPSLAFGLYTHRRARALGRPALASRLACLLLLAVCTLVPLLATLAHWTSGQGAFPWLTWAITLGTALLTWLLGLRRPRGAPPAVSSSEDPT
jgi:hypothetical protein